MKSPLFIEGGAGEWSEATMSTCPRTSSSHRARADRSRAQRRRTLGDRAQPLDILVGEEQIVRARFDGHIHSLRPRFGRQSDPASQADVDDVQAGAGFFREQERTLDRLELGDHRPRVEKGPHGSRRDACTRPRVNSSLSACTATGSRGAPLHAGHRAG